MESKNKRVKKGLASLLSTIRNDAYNGFLRNHGIPGIFMSMRHKRMFLKQWHESISEAGPFKELLEFQKHGGNIEVVHISAKDFLEKKPDFIVKNKNPNAEKWN